MITQILGIGTLLTRLAKLTGSGGEHVATAEKILNTVGTAYNTLSTTSASQSAGRYLISPMVAVQRELVHQEYMGDLMTTLLLRDIKDVLGHLAMQGQVGGIKITDLIAEVNPRRRGGFLSLSGMEAFNVGGMEAAPKAVDGKVTIGGKTYEELNVQGNLAVGRTVTAQVQVGDTQLTFPLTFREIPMAVSSNDLEQIFTAAQPKDGMFARAAMFDAGEIDSPEFFTGIDVIKKEFNIRNNDMSGYYEEATKRRDNNRIAALSTGIISVNTMANTIIMTADTARQIELELGIRFDKRGMDRIRKAVLANTIVIVDEGEGIVSIWNSGNNMEETYTLRQIAGIAKKDSSLDFQSLLKLFGGR